MPATTAIRDDRVTVVWEDGRTDEFHHAWLRDNCPCEQCRDPDAWERRFDTVAMPDDLRPAEVVADRGLAITWPDGHRTDLDEGWLREHAYGRARRTREMPPPTTWDASIADAPPHVDYTAVMTSREGLLEWLRLVDELGFAIVRDVPTHRQAVVALAERIAFVQQTNFGFSFEVISKPDPENLAYTSHRLYPHTDLPNRHSAVNLQLLHCIENSATGGESILIDGFAAARRLQQRDPSAYELLAGVEVPWRFHDRTTDIRNRFPVIATDGDGRLLEIRFNTAILAPLDIDPELVGPWYDALRTFGRIVREPDLAFDFRMRPGDCQVFDNQRVLHARAAFDPSSGHRHLQGCYVDKDDFRGRLRALERDLDPVAVG